MYFAKVYIKSIESHEYFISVITAKLQQHKSKHEQDIQ